MLITLLNIFLPGKDKNCKEFICVAFDTIFGVYHNKIKKIQSYESMNDFTDKEIMSDFNKNDATLCNFSSPNTWLNRISYPYSKVNFKLIDNKIYIIFQNYDFVDMFCLKYDFIYIFMII